MSFEYIIDFPCKPKKKLGRKAITIQRSARKSKGSYEAVGRMMLKNNPNMDVDSQILKGTIATPGGNIPNDRKMGDLKKEFMKYEKFYTFCSSCPCNVSGDFYHDPLTFGCLDYINYPISRLFEQTITAVANFIMERDTECLQGLFITFIWEHPGVGEQVANMRRREGVFFESPVPLLTKITGGRSRISSDQLMEVLLSNRINPQTGKVVILPFFNVVRDFIHAQLEKGNESIRSDFTHYQAMGYRRAIEMAVEHKCDVIPDM